MDRCVHIMTIFTSFPCRIESFSPVVIPIFREGAIFTVTECMNFIDVIPTEFGRKLPLSNLYPVTAIRGCAIPAASPIDIVYAGTVEHVVGYSDSNTEAQLRRIDKIWWLRDDNRRTSHIYVKSKTICQSH